MGTEIDFRRAVAVVDWLISLDHHYCQAMELIWQLNQMQEFIALK